MSELQRLKGTLEQIASAAKQTGGSLGQFKSKFTSHQQQVQQAISGSSQRKDQEVLQSLDAAAKQVDAAIRALENAAKVASNYGRSL